MDGRQISREFLELLYADFDDDAWLTLFAISRTGPVERHTSWHQVSDLDSMVICAHEYAPMCCVWFGVATRREQLDYGRGGAEDCTYLPGLWADIDVLGPNHAAGDLPPSIYAAKELLLAYPETPSLIVNTGGGLQPYWLSPEPEPITPEVLEVLDRWCFTWQTRSKERGWSIDNVWDVSRILRLPGTYNRKQPDAPVLVTFEEA